jgi:hypothetical protein
MLAVAPHVSRNVCDNRNMRGVLASEPTRAPREITWRKQNDRSVNLRHRIQCQIASHVPTARVTSHELTWREDSVSPALLIHTASHPKGRKSQGNFILWVYTERYVISGRIPEMPFIQFTAVPHVIFGFQQTARRPFSCILDAEEWRCPTSGTGVDTRRVQLCLDLSISSSVSDCCVLYCYVEIWFKQKT